MFLMDNSLTQRHIYVSGTAFSAYKVWWVEGEDFTKEEGVPCKVYGADFGQSLESA